MRVRTGTESIVSQMVSNKFSVPAPTNGTVTGIDEKNELLEFSPDPVKLNITKGLTVPFSKTFVSEAAKDHQAVQFVTDKSPGKIGDTFGIGDFAGTIEDLQPVQNLDKLPPNVKETYKGNLNRHLFLVTLTITPKMIQLPKQVYEYKTHYAMAEGTHLKQTLVPNVKTGQKVKKGDVLIYNSGFFKKNHDKWANNGDMGVQWKHGVLANVALVETSATYEDGCSISKELSEKLAMEPAYVREVTVKGDTAIENMVKIGDHVESTDNLCVLNEGALDALGSSDDPESIAFVDSLKQAVRARHAGYVKKISYVYSGDPALFHPSLRKPIEEQEKREHKLDMLSQKTGGNLTTGTGFVKPGTKYKGVEFTDDTVMIEITIEKKIPAEQADKICIMGSNKTVISNILEKTPEMSSTHEPVDVIFSATSIYKRIVLSPFTCGIPERNMEQVERNILAMAPEIH